MKFFKCLRYEMKNMLMQKEFLVALTLCFAFTLIWFIPSESRWFDRFFSVKSLSPEHMSFLYCYVLGRVLYQFVCPILASVPMACSYFREKKDHLDALLIPAVGRGRYVGAKALMTFVSGFIVSTLPFFITMLYSELIFQRNEMVTVTYPQFYDGFAQLAVEWNIFGGLMFTHPVLNHLLHITLVGLWSAGAALLSLGISFFRRRSYFINLLLGPIILLLIVTVLSAVGAGSFDPQTAFPLSPENMGSYGHAVRFNKDPRVIASYSYITPSKLGVLVVYSAVYAAGIALPIIHVKKHRNIV